MNINKNFSRRKQKIFCYVFSGKDFPPLRPQSYMKNWKIIHDTFLLKKKRYSIIVFGLGVGEVIRHILWQNKTEAPVISVLELHSDNVSFDFSCRIFQQGVEIQQCTSHRQPFTYCIWFCVSSHTYDKGLLIMLWVFFPINKLSTLCPINIFTWKIGLKKPQIQFPSNCKKYTSNWSYVVILVPEIYDKRDGNVLHLLKHQ